MFRYFNMKRLLFLLSLVPVLLQAQMVKPTEAQVRWQRMEMNLFCHFGPNTFTGNEWGNGKEPASLFNPSALDCNQWCEVAKAAGMKGIIITAKHHDGFCLWPSEQSNHTVRESPWREGKGDVLRELSEACQKAGLKFGVYVSPWDRNAPSYGTMEYNEVFSNTLKEVHTQYGDVFEQWFDGACGEGPNGKRQQYDWERFNNTVLTLHPNASIFSDVGPGCRWMGNESGVNGKTCWSTLNTRDAEGRIYEPGANSPCQETLNRGDQKGDRWIPAETDVSIRPGWFWRASEHPKSVEQLLSIYYTSVGRNSLLLLNVPPDNRGLIDREDSIRLVEFRQALDSIFAHDLAQGAKVKSSSGLRAKQVTDTNYHTYYACKKHERTIRLKWKRPIDFNRLMIQEYIPEGQRIEEMKVKVRYEGDKSWYIIGSATTVGYKRILLFPQQHKVTEMEIIFPKTLGRPILNRVALFQDNIFDGKNLLEETVGRTTDNLINQ